MNAFKKTTLFTDTDGRARFREELIEFNEGTPQLQLSASFPCKSYQLRHSPVGFVGGVHCTGSPTWVFILGGQMEVFLLDGSSRTFKSGESFLAADALPAGAEFNEKLHGHYARQVGPEPLVTLFVRE
ncbi:hypothetical protein B5E41_30550 [Rhizobium esperanzae]|uniref:Cupin n=1 Tax=Rhizobium esperanzae TaxID=1967781 RepID=A0A246DKH2_9HYPH|nr:hypothetical protein [Rhizobium esperanzae]OWO89469.1 hypothetical protein B5E41_30550 [Rhizobium esperanzae]